ncbi:hypothetical protein [Fimbriiglobus ruber]|uniref:Uncharacterized protein n=1 Tax=Fimbriiglobus ruber TaxID=1908690 RepID=A0A225D3T2_9BACT|nr:hypothetical protein [Fimbriiglobus ruber]OWK36240.1 hypothetical protein FRUB_08803 [Fimbriiglobus ruber]
MDAAAPPRVEIDFGPAPVRLAAAPSPAPDEKRTELILDALKRGLADSGEHRLYRSGKLPGLFPTRTGPAADAALVALADGLIDTVRTEAKGKLIVEWVRVTPKGVAFVHERDTPKAVLRELRDLIGPTRDGVPVWMADMRDQVAALQSTFENRAADLLKRLDGVALRVEAALRRADLGSPQVSGTVRKLVPWAIEALEYLDRRATTTGGGPCPLRELFQALRDHYPDLTLPSFHAGLQRLHDNRAVRLTGANGTVPDPEYAMFIGAGMCCFAER